MFAEFKIPWPGMLLAAITLLMLGQTQLPTLILLVTGFFWLLSLWIEWLRPQPNRETIIRRPRADADVITRGAITSTIESLSVPLVVMDRQRIMAANLAARTAFGSHIVGQDARIALRHPDAIGLLEMEDGHSVTIRALTGAGSLWQLTRQRIDARYWTIELRDRTSEADIASAHTDFVANASHELRTPLSSIIGYVETLSEAPAAMDPATTKRFLGTVLREARRMQSLVSDLMSLSQLEAEKHDLPTERIDMGQLATRVAGEFAPGPGQKHSRVVLTPPQSGMGISGDPRQVEQLLRNLIDNALKYGDPDTPVEVIVAPAPRGMVEMRVSDHGPGIAPDHLPHLTRRFYRTDPGRSRQAGGTGLGLAIVKHIVERHRGRLDISSQLGEGTQVSVRLPLVGATKA